jgi:hypothetical protein
MEMEVGKNSMENTKDSLVKDPCFFWVSLSAFRAM